MKFRIWCQEKWFEHKDELLLYQGSVSYTSAEYFAKYKYWLKREYKFQKDKQ